jgi:hypothetical protein
VYGLQVQTFHILLMSLALFEFRIGQSFLRQTFLTICDSNSPSLLLVMLRVNILLTTSLFLSIFLLYIISRSRNFKYHFSLQEIPLQGITFQEFPLLEVYFQEILCTILDKVIILLPVSWV